MDSALMGGVSALGGPAEAASRGALPASEHALREPWCLWFTRKGNKKRSESWYEVKPVCTMRSVEEFWRAYSHALRPNSLQSPSDYHLFKEGIKPLWEDEANAKGGKWMVRLRKGLASEKWENLVLALLGDQLGQDSGDICGAVVSVRYQEDIVAVWNKNSKDEAAKLRIKEAMIRALELPVDTVVEYKEHNISLRDNSSFRNTNVYKPPGMRGQGAASQKGGSSFGGSGGGGGNGGRRNRKGRNDKPRVYRPNTNGAAPAQQRAATPLVSAWGTQSASAKGGASAWAKYK